ncbi:DUF4142 domain-containing protein [Mucilaginibacter rubeus]|nr:DUF4142 domain-containing protein [Mucilaginibacter rubeus]QEM17636.1 DUF4142 domain-containing protein [Mucilaginibacter gossypii]QTF61769.1 DUF4142 domain-containing protein [Mucilaginibacter rubeus]
MFKSFTAGAETLASDPMAANEKEFRMGVIGPAELSLATSQIAVSKATNKNVKEFAGFELGEAIAVIGVLKDLGTSVPPMDAKAKATLEKIKSTPAGLEFDKVYIKVQLENHEFLRDFWLKIISVKENWPARPKIRAGTWPLYRWPFLKSTWPSPAVF